MLTELFDRQIGDVPSNKKTADIVQIRDVPFGVPQGYNFSFKCDYDDAQRTNRHQIQTSCASRTAMSSVSRVDISLCRHR